MGRQMPVRATKVDRRRFAFKLENDVDRPSGLVLVGEERLSALR